MIRKNKDNEYDIDWYDQIKNFRAGPYEEASDEVKDAWYWFVSLILPVAVSAWNPDKCIRKNISYDSIVSASDELMTITIVTRNCKRWNEHIDDQDSDAKLGKKPYSMQEKVDFFKDLKEIAAKRKTEDEGASWNDGFVERHREKAAEATEAASAGASHNDSHENDADPVEQDKDSEMRRLLENTDAIFEA